ncbi:MAG: lysophospholipid acyltransferase family protein [Microbacterium sp.]
MAGKYYAPRRFHSPLLRLARRVAQRGLLKTTVWRLTRVTVEGTEHLDEVTGPYIAVGNHSSHLDAPLIVCSLPWNRAKNLSTGAAADYFFDVKWRTWLTVLFFNTYPVDRTGGGKHPRLSKALLADGCPLLLFPEGGRAKQNEPMREFKLGAAALSIGTGHPVVPIGLIDAQKAMPRGRNWPVRGRTPVAVRIGTPMYARQDERPEQFTRRLELAVAALSKQVAPPSKKIADAPEHVKKENRTHD